MDPALKTDANCIRGCVSQVWVHAAPKEGAPDRVSFQADSDAQLTKGLAALLVLGLFDAPARDVAMVPVEFIELLGIRQSLSPSRNSGLLNMISLMKHKVLEITIGELWDDRTCWELSKLNQIFDQPMVQHIMKVQIVPRDNEDKICWIHNSSGECTSKSAYKQVYLDS
uniref:Fe-S metabolism associated domain-containing protein n=1 Tax=Oryza rufipogon TaxID=4529 RepID=A0A0E0NPU7_ORYRU